VKREAEEDWGRARRLPPPWSAEVTPNCFSGEPSILHQLTWEIPGAARAGPPDSLLAPGTQNRTGVVTRLKPVCYAFETNEIEVEKGSEKNCPGPCWPGGTAFRPLGLVDSRFDGAPKVPK
jgi:hypothetical protein